MTRKAPSPSPFGECSDYRLWPSRIFTSWWEVVVQHILFLQPKMLSPHLPTFGFATALIMIGDIVTAIGDITYHQSSPTLFSYTSDFHRPPSCNIRFLRQWYTHLRRANATSILRNTYCRWDLQGATTSVCTAHAFPLHARSTNRAPVRRRHPTHLQRGRMRRNFTDDVPSEQSQTVFSHQLLSSPTHNHVTFIFFVDKGVCILAPRHWAKCATHWARIGVWQPDLSDQLMRFLCTLGAQKGRMRRNFTDDLTKCGLMKTHEKLCIIIIHEVGRIFNSGSLKKHFFAIRIQK